MSYYDPDPNKIILDYTAHFKTPEWVSNLANYNFLKDKRKFCSHCRQSFTAFGRYKKHHCRLCGELLCTACTTKLHIPSKFEKKQGKRGPGRVCHSCRDSCLLKKLAAKPEDKDTKDRLLRWGITSTEPDPKLALDLPKIITPPENFVDPNRTNDECAKCYKQKQKRYHCVACGFLFCNDCSEKRMVPETFQKTRGGGEQRVCDFCRYRLCGGWKLGDRSMLTANNLTTPVPITPPAFPVSFGSQVSGGPSVGDIQLRIRWEGDDDGMAPLTIISCAPTMDGRVIVERFLKIFQQLTTNQILMLYRGSPLQPSEWRNYTASMFVPTLYLRYLGEQRNSSSSTVAPPSEQLIAPPTRNTGKASRAATNALSPRATSRSLDVPSTTTPRDQGSSRSNAGSVVGNGPPAPPMMGGGAVPPAPPMSAINVPTAPPIGMSMGMGVGMPSSNDSPPSTSSSLPRIDSSSDVSVNSSVSQIDRRMAKQQLQEKLLQQQQQQGGMEEEIDDIGPNDSASQVGDSDHLRELNSTNNSTRNSANNSPFGSPSGTPAASPRGVQRFQPPQLPQTRGASKSVPPPLPVGGKAGPPPLPGGSNSPSQSPTPANNSPPSPARPTPTGVAALRAAMGAQLQLVLPGTVKKPTSSLSSPGREMNGGDDRGSQVPPPPSSNTNNSNNNSIPGPPPRNNGPPSQRSPPSSVISAATSINSKAGKPIDFNGIPYDPAYAQDDQPSPYTYDDYDNGNNGGYEDGMGPNGGMGGPMGGPNGMGPGRGPNMNGGMGPNGMGSNGMMNRNGPGNGMNGMNRSPSNNNMNAMNGNMNGMNGNMNGMNGNMNRSPSSNNMNGMNGMNGNMNGMNRSQSSNNMSNNMNGNMNGMNMTRPTSNSQSSGYSSNYSNNRPSSNGFNSSSSQSNYSSNNSSYNGSSNNSSFNGSSSQSNYSSSNSSSYNSSSSSSSNNNNGMQLKNGVTLIPIASIGKNMGAIIENSKNIGPVNAESSMMGNGMGRPTSFSNPPAPYDNNNNSRNSSRSFPSNNSDYNGYSNNNNNNNNYNSNNNFNNNGNRNNYNNSMSAPSRGNGYLDNGGGFDDGYGGNNNGYNNNNYGNNNSRGGFQPSSRQPLAVGYGNGGGGGGYGYGR